MQRFLKQLSKLSVIAILTCLLAASIAIEAPHRLASARQVQGGTTDAGWTVIRAEAEPIEADPRGDQLLRIAGTTQLQSLDPAVAKDLATMFLVRQIFSGLTRLDDELQAVPALADEIEISPDGLTYRFHIADNAEFQDGRNITAADVAFSLNRTMNPETTGGDASQLAGPTFLADIEGTAALLAGKADSLSGITVEDEHSLEIQLSRPRSTFLMRLATAPASIVDPEDMSLGENWWQEPNGSGPFRVDHLEVDRLMVLESSGNYYRGKPPLDSIEVSLGTAAFQPMNLYETESIDISPVSYFALERAIDPANPLHADLRVSELFAVEYIAFRTDIEPLNDPQIRRALILGYPRQKVATVTFDNTVGEAKGLLPDGLLGRESWDVEGLDYDLEAARAAIATSSYGSPENVPPITIYATSVSRAESLRDVLRKDLGLKIEVIFVDWPEFNSGLAKKLYPAYLLYWGVDYPDPESLLLTLFGTGQADNYVGYSNTEFDQLLDEAAAEQDPDRRVEIYSRANQILMNDAVVLPLYYDRSYMLVHSWVKGVDVTPLGILYLDEVWIER
jgi:oligopeptide transport system substrate-binding protein